MQQQPPHEFAMQSMHGSSSHHRPAPPANDGRLSIEHQLSIHIYDLFDCTRHPNAPAPAVDAAAPADSAVANSGKTPAANNAYSVSLTDVLAGIRYVMEYRLKGGRQPHLDAELMKKLAEGLLMHMTHRESTLLLSQRMTPDADLALALFGEFVEEVDEFRHAVAGMALADFRHSFKIDTRCRFPATAEQKLAAVNLLCIMCSYMPTQFPDWRDFVRESHHDQVQEVMQELGVTDPSTSRPGNMAPKTRAVVYPPPALYFDRSVVRVLDMFKTDLAQGLSSARIGDLIDNYGTNDLPPPPSPSMLKMLWQQVTDFMVIILIIAAFTSLGMGDAKSCIVLLVVVVINVLIGFIQDVKANRALNALISLSVPKATVLRDGKQESIPSGNLVPGDVVILDEGDAVPADLRLVEVAQLEIIESVLTGESLPVSKNTDAIRTRTRKLPLGDCHGNAFMSTVVARGRGKGVVVRTGYRTEMGKISSAISATTEVQTPMQMRLARLGIYLVILSVLLCLAVVAIGLGRGRPTQEMVTLGVSLAVSVIPEGLVAVVTITMAVGVWRMAQNNAIVRKFHSVETLGSVTVICSDKTGTLTEGKMSAQAMWTTDGQEFVLTADPSTRDASQGMIYRTSGSGAEKKRVELKKSLDDGLAFSAAMMVCGLCNNSSYRLDPEKKEFVSVGDPTEVALLLAARKANMDKQAFWEEQMKYKKCAEFAFDSDRKRMSSIYERAADAAPDARLPPSRLILVKGAPEALLSACTAYIPHGAATMADCKTIDDAFVGVISAQSSKMASNGLRVLGLAIRPLSPDFDIVALAASNESSQAEKELTFVGLVGLIDPPRAGVKESVQACHKAGVKVIMITGDHIVTAMAVATSLSILDPANSKQNRAIKGAELDLLSDEELKFLDPFPNVFARVSPDNKLRIVQALQAVGHSVAMTGDGVNDAPAIKAANVGVAMGISGTEITKQAADIVLATDNFTTIESAVLEGRRVFDNIQKFVLYLLSCNFAEIFVMLLAIAIGAEAPFTSMMILYANIIADIPPSMSIGIEPAEADVMERPPRDPKRGVITKTTAFIIFYQSSTMGVIALAGYLWKLQQLHGTIFTDSKDGEAQTFTFVMLTIMQLAQAFMSRSVESSIFTTGVVSNRWMVVAFFVSFLFLMAGVYLPPLAESLTLTALTDGYDWLKIVVAVMIQLALSELLKYGVRSYRLSQRAGLPTHNINASEVSLAGRFREMFGRNYRGLRGR